VIGNVSWLPSGENHHKLVQFHPSYRYIPTIYLPYTYHIPTIYLPYTYHIHHIPTIYTIYTIAIGVAPSNPQPFLLAYPRKKRGFRSSSTHWRSPSWRAAFLPMSTMPLGGVTGHRRPPEISRWGDEAKETTRNYTFLSRLFVLGLI